MRFFAKRKKPSTPAPGPPEQGPALESPEEGFGCEIIYERKCPLKAEYVLSFYDGGTSDNK